MVEKLKSKKSKARKKEGPTLAKWLEDNNQAPWDLDEVASSLMEVTDAPEVVAAAKEYETARDKFEKKIADIGFEFG